MGHKDTVFYRVDIAISLDFSAEEISTDEALLLEMIERKHGLIRYLGINIL